jgi:hypothetical protein
MSTRKLTIDDIADLRAYEREREDFRRHIIELKARRRVSIGPFVTLLFENRETIRFQIQEMARVERLYSDEQIEHELSVYNPLIPEAGELAATMFLELRTEAELREWLPKLVGIERAAVLRVGAGADAESVPLTVDADHAGQLTREDTTSAVHYVHATLRPDQIARFDTGNVVLAIEHPAYRHELALGPDTVAELLTDLRG